MTDDEWLTPSEAANRIGYSAGSIRRLKRQGSIEAIPVMYRGVLKNTYRISAWSLQNYLDGNPEQRKPHEKKAKI
jgi:hypothetical protein